MQVFKFILLFFIFCGSSYIGLLISKRYSNRAEELKQIKNALNMLETKIKFTYEPLPEIFNQIAKTVPKSIGGIFSTARNKMKTISVKEAWEYSVDNTLLSINKEDKNILKELGNLLRTN